MMDWLVLRINLLDIPQYMFPECAKSDFQKIPDLNCFYLKSIDV